MFESVGANTFSAMEARMMIDKLPINFLFPTIHRAKILLSPYTKNTEPYESGSMWWIDIEPSDICENSRDRCFGYYNPKKDLIVIETADRTREQIHSTIIHELAHRYHYILPWKFDLYRIAVEMSTHYNRWEDEGCSELPNDFVEGDLQTAILGLYVHPFIMEEVSKDRLTFFGQADRWCEELLAEGIKMILMGNGFELYKHFPVLFQVLADALVAR